MYREDGLSSVDIKSETDTLRPDSPDGEGGLNSEYNTVKFVPLQTVMTSCGEIFNGHGGAASLNNSDYALPPAQLEQTNPPSRPARELDFYKFFRTVFFRACLHLN